MCGRRAERVEDCVWERYGECDRQCVGERGASYILRKGGGRVRGRLCLREEGVW